MKIIEKFNDRINGFLSGFDRMIIKGHIQQFYSQSGKQHFLNSNNIMYKDFGSYANKVTETLKNHVKELTEKENREYIYLNSPKISKQDTALKQLKDNPIESGLICTIATVELCSTLQVIKNYKTQKLELGNTNRKCTYFYFYILDPEFGLMHIKLQSWFPFMVQVYINGREYLARQLDKEGIKYERYDNSFTYIENLEKAQELADKMESVKLTGRLDAIVSKLNPYLSVIRDTFGMVYYWCVDQCEYATDIMFNSRKDLEEIYPSLVEHALVNFKCEDVMTFLGRKMHHAFQGEIVSDIKKRPQGVRIKHRMKSNSIKMYDKYSVLRIETTINKPTEFKIYKKIETDNGPQMRWVSMGKTIANIYRYAQVSAASNKRYLDALADAVPTGEIISEIEKITQRKKKNNKFQSGFNVLSPETCQMFSVIMDGAHTINGFTNKDICAKLFPTQFKEKRYRNKVTRLLSKLRAHGLIRKAPRSRKYFVSSKGYRIMGGILYLKTKEYPGYVLKQTEKTPA